MNRQQLVAILAKNMQTTQTNASNILDTVTTTIHNALIRGEEVKLTGFGHFKVKQRAARSGRNPMTGDVIKVPAKTVPTFTFAKAVRDDVDR